ncbi:ATP-binding protein [Natrarchaeobius oligotrophus]|uniref:GHKL domain-containing protein n=1 Tax=Natrarchaeobius chitinivorans TaxID=1679083 RepID=A0A3N6M5D1_NATCH|nr:ATP-binding protein [Natrarchaeobius chitinivorans]RQG98778.1 GHKL domain-containing protein [Natrarchaeobius chitinivorans]
MLGDAQPTDAHPIATPWTVSAFGALSAIALFVWKALFLSLDDAVSLALGFAVIVVPSLALVWAGYRLERGDVPPERYRRIVAWTAGCSVGFLAVNVPPMVLFPWYGIEGTLGWVHFSIVMGAVAGFAIGYVEARSIQQEVEATAAAVRAEQLEYEREMLRYLNDLLRHEVLNSAQIVGGHASLLLAEEPDDRTRSHLETIQRRSESLEDVIDDVRTMLDANECPTENGAVDLSDLVAETVASFRSTYDRATVDATVPASAVVVGNAGVRRIVWNLLENAVEHHDGERPRIDLRVEATADAVVLRVTDDGPGIPEERRGSLFQRKSRNHGLGLYLVRILANRYGGDVELVETGPDGTTVAVTLPRADDDFESANRPDDSESKRDVPATSEPDAD